MVRSPVSCDSHDYRTNTRMLRSIGNGTGSLNGNSLRKPAPSISSASDKCSKTLSHPMSRIRNRGYCYDLEPCPPPMYECRQPPPPSPCSTDICDESDEVMIRTYKKI